MAKRTNLRLIAVAILMVILLSSQTVLGLEYQILDLGNLGGNESRAYCINEAGQIVGWAQTTSRKTHAFIYDGVMTDLGTLGGNMSEAYGLNDNGQIVGKSVNTAGRTHGFLYENGVMTDLGTLGGNESSCGAINNNGVIVGSSKISSGYWRAMIYKNGVMSQLPKFAGTESWASAINSSGQIIGGCNVSGGSPWHACLWENNIIIDLGTLPGTSKSNGNGINDDGQMTGFSNNYPSLPCSGFIHKNGSMNPIGSLGQIPDNTRPRSINNQGKIVGHSHTVTGQKHAFLYEDGIMTDLGTLGGNSSEAHEINNSGLIVGWAETAEGKIHAALWVPATLGSLEIVGLESCAENSSAQYRAIAHYETGDEVDIAVDVTDSADWSVEPNDIASIAAGLLTTEAIDLPQDIIITAQYGEGDVNEVAEKEVSIFAICPSGSALEFDGQNDYVNCGNDESLDLQADGFTVQAWVKLNPSPKNKWLVAKGQWGNDMDGDYWLNLHPSNNNFNLAIRTSAGVYRSPQHSYSMGQWYCVTGVFDGSSLALYVNGQLVGTPTPVAGSIVTNNHIVQIGGNPTGHATIDGFVDEVAIYNRALSAEEIRRLMHSRPEAGEPNLVGYWDFDEGEGDIAGDASGNGNDGTIIGAQWTDDIPPVGICSVEGIVERNLLNVLGMKNDVLDILDEAIGKEEALWEYMDIVFRDRDFGNTSKGDVVKAKQKIHSAIQQEEQAETAVDQSIDKLDDALNTLGIE